MMDPLYRGETVIAHEGRNDATTWPRLIAKHGATIFIGVPTVYRQIIQKTDLAARDVPTLRHCMSAGEHLSDEVLAQWRSRFGMDIYEAVGMSEFSYYLSQSKHRPIRPAPPDFRSRATTIRLLDPETLREVGARRGRHDLRARDRSGPLPRVLEPAGGNGEAPARRLVLHRRLRALRRGRLHLVPRPQGRHHQELRLPCLAVRGRARAEGAPGGRRLRVRRRGSWSATSCSWSHT